MTNSTVISRTALVGNTCDGRRYRDKLGRVVYHSARPPLYIARHDAREAARRAGPSATADIFSGQGRVHCPPGPVCVHVCVRAMTFRVDQR